MKYLKAVEDFLQPIGYTTTTIGTVVGIVALIMTILVNNKTNKIKENIERIQVVSNFNFTRLDVINKAKLVYSKFKNDGDLLIFEIKEIVIDLGAYEKILTNSMNQSLAQLKKFEEDLKARKGKIPKKEMDEVIMHIYNIQRKLESNVDILNENEGEKK